MMSAVLRRFFIIVLVATALSAASSPVGAGEEPAMTPARFLDMVRRIAEIDDFHRVDEIGNIVGVPLFKHSQIPYGTYYYPKVGSEPEWLFGLSVEIGRAKGQQYWRHSVFFTLHKSDLCLTIEDVISEFGEAFETYGPHHKIIDFDTPEAAAEYQRKRIGKYYGIKYGLPGRRVIGFEFDKMICADDAWVAMDRE